MTHSAEWKAGYEQARFDFIAVVKIAQKDVENSKPKKLNKIRANRYDAVEQTMEQCLQHIRDLKTGAQNGSQS